MSSNSPCAACKLQRRKCTPGCVFAPYFPPDHPHKFVCVHRVFGASNVAKLLNDLSPAQREDAANSLAYEAEMRLRDPVYGCVGYISVLQHRVRQVQHDLQLARKELSTFIGAAALGPFLPHHHQLGGPAPPPHAQSFGPGMGIPGAGLQSVAAAPSQILMREQQQQPQQMAAMAVAAAREHEMLRSYEQQYRHELARLNAGFPESGRGPYNQISDGALVAVPTGLAIEVTPLAAVHPQQHYSGQQPQHHRARSDEGKSGIGPSS
ncbi:hypothetical protein Cni_G05770 [Canna indica]|uniref:LOB domain-containing protein n=1 Tax=Canna indica TaxID=4628 RepID=A0AAQ3JVQ7_9LILI|nr:hypothetical protein Cni_G05770 [Canna indica]